MFKEVVLNRSKLSNITGQNYLMFEKLKRTVFNKMLIVKTK